ncbi:MAG: hypothetical protein KBT79_08870 [Thalassolituus oleivorans]|nr:hypothetical protein [Thalassolituus oleivorans]
MSTNQAIEKLFEGVIPERVNEVMTLVEKYEAQFRVVGDKQGFNLDAGGFGAVQFTQRSLDQLWIFGYAGMQALHCYSGIISTCHSHNINFDIKKIGSLPEQVVEDKKFFDTIQYIKKLSTVENANDFEWPPNIPNPEHGKPKNKELSVVFDLTLMATAHVFLHELKHVIFQAEGDAPKKATDEEIACDKFAAGMMLDKIKEYSIVSKYPEDKVRMKRSMGIALASAFLLLATPLHCLNGTATHPPVHSRWSAVLKNIELPDNDYYWLYFSSFAIGLMKHLNIKVSAQPVPDFKTFAIKAIEGLENGI